MAREFGAISRFHTGSSVSHFSKTQLFSSPRVWGYISISYRELRFSFLENTAFQFPASLGLYLDFIPGAPFLISRKHSFSVPREFGAISRFHTGSSVSHFSKTQLFSSPRVWGYISISYRELRFSFLENTAFQFPASLGPYLDFIPGAPFLISRKHSFSVPRTRFVRDRTLIVENTAFQFIVKHWLNAKSSQRVNALPFQQALDSSTTSRGAFGPACDSAA
jgi:hypothetical protein